MGVVGTQKKRISGRDLAAPSNILCFQQDHADPVSSRQCEKATQSGRIERTANSQRTQLLSGYTGIQIGYRTDDEIEGEAPGYVITEGRVFLATSALPSSGASVILAVREETPSEEIKAIAGKVTAVFPKADEFGFPPGFGVSVTEGFEVLGRLMTLPEAQSKS
jgi:hypothetical protein